MAKLQTKLINGVKYTLYPVDFLNKVFSQITLTMNDRRLNMTKRMATSWMRRTVWEDMKIINFEQRDKGESEFIPLTIKEFRWLKAELENPI
jgi:hypothetical protein